MITLSLDEFGDFEHCQNTGGPVYIGGLLYDDAGDAGEQSREKSRIRGYYQKVIAEAAAKPPKDPEHPADPADFCYPQALHSKNDPGWNSNIVGPVKEMVRHTLQEFLQNGTYQGQPVSYTDRNGGTRSLPARKGKYYLFAILKSAEGMSELLNERANFLAKDDYGSNLYFHMADILVTRLVFYNPLIENVNDLAFYLATRVSPDLGENSHMAAQYKKQGYKAYRSRNDGQVFFQLTNPDIYRTVLAEEMLDAGRPDLKITNFQVNSITYKETAYNMEYMYLADTICSYLQFIDKEKEKDWWENQNKKTANDWLERLKEKTAELTGAENSLIFGYDGIDQIFSKAWARYEEGDFYGALSLSFDARRKKGAFAKHYNLVWFKELKRRIQESKDAAAFSLAVRKLRATLTTNTLDQEKALYILRVLLKMANEVSVTFNTSEAKRVLYELYDCAMTSYCHLGNSKMAERYFKKCMKHAGSVSLDDYLYTRNRMVVFCCDYFQLEYAKGIADENIGYQKRLTEVKRDLKIPGVHETGYAAMGIAHSQRAQVYAFLRNSEAEAEFRAALKNYEKNSANYKITQSYLLHYYLDSGKRGAYLEEAADYFGGERGLKKQLDYILREGSQKDPVINMKYALYVFIRGLYLFRMEALSDKLWKALQKVEETFGQKIRKKDWQLTGHPAELIFKYLRLIALFREDPGAEQEYAERMASCLRYYGPTEEVIRKFGEVEIAEKKGETDRRDTLSAELIAYMKQKYQIFRNMQTPEDGEERYRWLDQHITFMYR